MKLGWLSLFALLHVAPFYIHYLFASQTAHVGTLYAAFLALMLDHRRLEGRLWSPSSPSHSNCVPSQSMCVPSHAMCASKTLLGQLVFLCALCILSVFGRILHSLSLRQSGPLCRGRMWSVPCAGTVGCESRMRGKSEASTLTYVLTTIESTQRHISTQPKIRRIPTKTR
jgi:hypothetical protein